MFAKCSLNKASKDQIKEPKHVGYYLISTVQICFHITFILLFILLYLSFVTLLSSTISQISIKWEEAQCYFDLITAYRLHSPPIQGVLAECNSKPWPQVSGRWIMRGGWGGHFLQGLGVGLPQSVAVHGSSKSEKQLSSKFISGGVFSYFAFVFTLVVQYCNTCAKTLSLYPSRFWILHLYLILKSLENYLYFSYWLFGIYKTLEKSYQHKHINCDLNV